METLRYCKKCGYDLRASEGRCPECGRGFDGGDAKTYRKRPLKPGWVRVLLRCARVFEGALILIVLVWAGLYWGWRSEQKIIGAIGESNLTLKIEPLGGEKIKRMLGPMGFVLDRVRILGVSSRYRDQFGDKELKEVCDLKYVTQLEIAGTQVSDAGMVDLLKLSKLRQLELGWTQVSNEGMRILTGHPKLFVVAVDFSKVTPEALSLFPETVWVCGLKVDGAPLSRGSGVPGTKNLKKWMEGWKPTKEDPLAGAIESEQMDWDTKYKYKEYFIPGEKIGERHFHSNGKVSEEAGMKNGLKEGLAREFYPSGKISREYVYREGKLEGASRRFYESGAVFVDQTYHDNKLDGLARYYREDGELIGESKLEKGNGVLRVYAVPPIQMTDEELPHVGGLLEGTVLRWGEIPEVKGKGFECVEYEKGRKSGRRVVFDGAGKLRVSENYLAGDRHGVFRRYIEDGTIEALYTRHYLFGRYVAEETYLKAAEEDEILKRLLEDNGEAWGREKMKM